MRELSQERTARERTFQELLTIPLENQKERDALRESNVRAFVEGAAWARHEKARTNGELTNFASWSKCNMSWRQQGRARVRREASIESLIRLSLEDEDSE